MTLTNYTDIKQWRVLPIYQINISYPSTEGGGLYLYLRNFKNGATCEINPMLRDNDEGGQKIVGLKVEANFALFQNNLETMRPTLDFISNYTPDGIYIYLYNLQQLDHNWNGEMIKLDLLNEPSQIAAHKNFNLTWKMGVNNQEPEIQFSLKGYLTKDVLQNIYPQNQVFTEYNWRTITW